MLRRLVIVLLTLGLLAGVVLAEERDGKIDWSRPFEGYCVNDEPVIIYWDPDLDKYFDPHCEGKALGLQQREIEDVNPPMELIEFPDPPEDWSAWAHVWLNGQAVRNPYRDVLPYVTASTGRTLIPLRMVTEAMGGTAEWEEATRKVTIRLGEKYMEMVIGQPAAVANDQEVTLDQPPLLWLNRTMVPLRVVVEAFGAQVNWNGLNQRVDILLDGITCTPGYCIEWLS